MSIHHQKLDKLYKALENGDNIKSQLEPRLALATEVKSADERKEVKSAESRQNSTSHHRIHWNQLYDEVNSLKKDKEVLLDQVKVQLVLIESQKKTLVDYEKRNQKFLEVVKELEQNEEDLVSEIKNLAREKQTLEIRNNEQIYDKFNLQMKNTELSRLCDNSDSELDIVRKKFEVEQKKNKECMIEVQRLNEQNEKEILKGRSHLQKERDKNEDLDSEASISLIAKREQEENNEVNDLRLELQMRQVQIEKLELDKSTIKRQSHKKDMIIKELRHENESFKEQIKLSKKKNDEEIQRERVKTRTLAETSQKIHDDLEQELAKVRDELIFAEKRNSWYEVKYDLCDAVQYQKKLTRDIRRRDFEHQQNMILLGGKDDQIYSLQKVCSAMRNVLGPEYIPNGVELQTRTTNDEDNLYSHIRELNAQSEELQKGEVRLKKALRGNAAVPSEDGGFWCEGLDDCEQIMQVNDFERNINEGKGVQLPLNEVGELISELSSKMKFAKFEDSMTKERHECEFESKKAIKDAKKCDFDDELRFLRKMLLEIQCQNEILRNKIDALNKRDKKDDYQPTKAPALSSVYKRRIESIIGETLQPENVKSLNQFHCFFKEYIKLESELSIIKASLHRWSIKNYPSQSYGHASNTTRNQSEIIHRSPEISHVEKIDAVMQTDVHDQIKISKAVVVQTDIFTQDISQQTIEIRSTDKIERLNNLADEIVEDDDKTPPMNSMSYLPKSIANVTVRHEDFACQVCICDSDELNDKLGEMQNELKNKRLKNSLKHATLSMFNEKRALISQASMEQLMVMIDKKNEIIQKYRNKCMSAVNNQEVIDTKKADESLGNIPGLKEPGEKYLQNTETFIVRRLSETNNLIKEKEQWINQLQKELEASKRNADLYETRYNGLTIELSKLTLTNKELKDRLHQVETFSREIGRNNAENKVRFEIERNHLVRNVNDTKLESKLKDEKIQIMQSCTSHLKNKVKGFEENTKKISMLESDIKRMNIELCACQRSRGRWERALKVSKSKAADVIQDMEQLQKKVNSLRKEALDAKQAKISMMTKSKQLSLKLKDVQELAVKQKELMTQSGSSKIVEEYKKRILTLKEDNTKLRGTIASYAMENNKSRVASGKNCSSISKLRMNQETGERSKWHNIQRRAVHKSCQTMPHYSQDQSMSSPFMTKVNDQPSQLVRESNVPIPLKKLQYMNQNQVHIEYKQGKYCILPAKQPCDPILFDARNQINELTAQNKVYMKEMKELKDCMARKQQEVESLKRRLESIRSDRDDSNKCCKIVIPRNKSEEKHPQAPNHVDTNHLRMELQDMKQQLPDAHSLAESNKKIHQLNIENTMLKNELSAFTLEFFEEIEDLKFNYSEAKEKIAFHEL